MEVVGQPGEPSRSNRPNNMHRRLAQRHERRQYSRIIWYLDFSYLGLFVPWTIRTIDGLFVPSMNYSYLGLFVPWTVRTLLDCSYHGLFVLDDSYRDARLTKSNVSYQNVTMFSVSQTPLNFSDIFPKRLGLFSPNFTFRLYIPIYAGLQVFI